MNIFYSCCDDLRRAAIAHHATLMGIDFLDVTPDQRQLRVHFVPAAAGVAKPVTPPGLTADNIRIAGGERITRIRVTGVAYDGDVLVVAVDDDDPSANGVGDFSRYTFELVQVPGLDPRMSAVDFSFKVGCPSDFDCQPSHVCPPPTPVPPDINYLAKDYASFRQLLLDRLNLLMPQWTERNPADLGVTLIELLAFVGDQLSYRQDAVATEAYLATARRRTSVRRHARLVDYFMHDGVNARVWAQFQVNADDVPLPAGTQLLSHVAGQPRRTPGDSRAYARVLDARSTVFETLYDATLHADHNQLPFYTWGARRCCLPKGVTRATLRGHFPRLAAGDVLILAELLDPDTQQAEDADPAHRHAVRLTDAIAFDAGQPLVDPLTGQPITNIAWGAADALPFPLCVSIVSEASAGDLDAAVALGNVVLADHGQTIPDEHPLRDGDHDRVPQPTLFRAGLAGGDRCQDRQRSPLPPRFRPRLAQSPLTFAVPYDVNNPPPSATAATRVRPEAAIPEIELTSHLDGRSFSWIARRDLLDSAPNQTEFVVEVESSGEAYLRFGDGQLGVRPDPGTQFTAKYRVGNGTRGNVGADSLFHIVSNDERIDSVRNPLPAVGGVDSESIERVRQNAPAAFRRQERAVTPADYAAAAERHDEVQRAAATFRWTGSWYTVFLTIDRLGGRPVDRDFEAEMRRHLERFRMAGYDLEIDGPRYVSLEIDLHVCVLPDYFRTAVQAALLQLFSNRDLPDGRRGLFHPDNFSFGESVFASQLIAAAQAVPGVESVRLLKFQRQGQTSDRALISGQLDIRRLEIARLDNDRSFPERGVFRLAMGGGK